MPGHLILIWDYDAAIGQVNSTYPYNFHEDRIFEEIANVETILELGREFEIRMTFACTGFTAEPGQFPYHAPDQIRKIHSLGHEIASHSWRHEWLPYLEPKQVQETLARSKHILESCLGIPGAVKGFVPPFSRPMSWYRKGAWSLGDRAFGPKHPGSNLGSLLKLVHEAGYSWCRVAYRSLWKKMTAKPLTGAYLKKWEQRHGVMCVPEDGVGFTEWAHLLSKKAIEEKRPTVITAHPSGINRNGVEAVAKLRHLLRTIADYQQKGVIESSTVSQYVGLSNESFSKRETGRVMQTSG
jgi:peptidoglycan/xylan/chitin deacetylase (PgdA/CDA1 family)